MLFLDMMCNEIDVLIFGHGDMYSIHCWNKFLYIIVAHFLYIVETIIDFCANKNMFTCLSCRCKVSARTKTCLYVFLCHCKVSAPAKTCFYAFIVM